MSLLDVHHLAHQLWIVWLLLIFIGIVFWAYRPRNRGRFDDDGNIPLRDDSEEC